MAINYIHPPTGETTPKEVWRWVAVYKDGSILEQFEVSTQGAIFHRFNEIDASKVDEFMLVHDNFQPIIFKIPEGAVLDHFYRHRIVHEMVQGGDEQLQREWKIKIWVIGFHVDKHYWLAFADESGHVTIGNDRELFQNKALPVGVK